MIAFETVWLLAGLIALFVGLLGVVVNREGKPTLLITSRRIRAAAALVGIVLLAASVWFKYLDRETSQRTIEERASPELASYLADCALELQRFESRNPEIPFRSSAFRYVFLSEDSAQGRPLDKLLLERLRNDTQSHNLYSVVSGPGTGKSTVISVMRNIFCREALSGHLKTMIIARDLRKDFKEDSDQVDLESFLTNLPTELSGNAIKKILLLDSLDELYFYSPQRAITLVNWAQGLVESKKVGVRVYLFSRPYAVANLNELLKREARPRINEILSGLRPDSEYYEKSLYRIVFHRSAWAPLPDRPEDVQQILGKSVLNAEERLNKFLGSPWADRARDRQLVYRDLEAILDAEDAAQSDYGLADTYYLYAMRSLERNLAVQIPKASDIDTLLRCLGWEYLHSTIQAKTVRGGGSNRPDCNANVEYRYEGETKSQAAETLLSERGMTIQSIEGYVQDVSAGVAFCLLDAGTPQEELLQLIKASDQGPAIALTAIHRIDTCPVRAREAELIGYLGQDVRKRFGLQTPNAGGA